MINPKRQLVDKMLSFKRERRFFGRYKDQIKKPAAVNIESIRKGTEFEKFIVQRFEPEYFSLIEWRSDKSIDGIYPLMNQFPDLEFYYESKYESLTFAIECKWRDSFYRDQIQLKESQLDNYRHYAEVTGHPTFIILGIGNIPGNPNQVYIVPLNKIEQPTLHCFNIEIFRRHIPGDNFFLTCSSLHLK